MILCKDCKHFEPEQWAITPFGNFGTESRCKHRGLKRVDPVYGGLIYRPEVNPDPHHLRRPEGLCGPDGRMYEAAPVDSENLSKAR